MICRCSAKRSIPLAIAILATLGGCKKEPEIRHYKEANLAQAKTDEPPPTKKNVEPVEAVPTRYLNAIAPKGGRSWFFKLAGTPEEMAKIEPAFQKFLASVKFPKEEGQAVTYDLPEGWKVGNAGQMRLATLLVPAGDKTLELSITQFGGDVKANIDRWRGELGLAPLGAIGDADYQKTVKETTVDGLKVYVVDMQGNKKPGGGMMPPFMKQ